MADACQKFRPPFVTLEGGEGSGKSTQAKMLGRRIRGLGLKVLITREPGGTSLGQQLRAMVTAGEDMDPDTELLDVHGRPVPPCKIQDRSGPGAR